MGERSFGEQQAYFSFEVTWLGNGAILPSKVASL
jgi:hypothetical protein